jgi:hypothetical protein
VGCTAAFLIGLLAGGFLLYGLGGAVSTIIWGE